ncbi:MAG: Asp23/Gls24 family envelope stress response protein [Lachnospiraceae bacterium]|nr:Asp23/Gls24 family envelope stress response protein [Lachnospiraceae bacterium]
MSMSNNNEKIGSIRIATDVVPLIAALASCDVEGVAPLQDKKNLSFKINLKRLTRGIKVDIKGRKVSVDMAIGILYGYQVPEISGKVQNSVKTTIETMTGLEVTDVNVRISSVSVA